MNFLLFLGPIIGVSVAIIASVVLISIIAPIAGEVEEEEE